MGKKLSNSRRNFLKVSVAGAAGLAIVSRVETIFASSAAVTSPGPGNKWPGRVVVNFNKAAIGTSGVDISVIRKMVNDAIEKLTDQTTLGDAWKAIFPASLTASSKIAIKVNTLNPGQPAPHWSSVRSITEGLQQMDFNGTTFPAGNITIYDMNNGLPNANNLGSAGYTAANFPGISIVTDTAIDGGDGALNNRTYAKTLKDANFLINVFGARGHNQPPTGSQFSLGFKSHFGTYSDATGLHNNITQNIRDTNCSGPVYNKTVLSMCSGIYGTNEGKNPAATADSFKTYAQSIDITSTTQCPTTIIMSTDPISAEMQAIKILRINNKGAYTIDDMPEYLRAAAGIEVAGWSPINNIGVIDESQMTIHKIVNGNEPVLYQAPSHGNFSGAGIVARQIKGHNSTYIEFKLPNEHVGKKASIEIFNSKGALVRKLSHKVLGVLNNLSWDEMNEQGALVSKGMYIVHLISNGKRASASVTIVR